MGELWIQRWGMLVSKLFQDFCLFAILTPESYIWIRVFALINIPNISVLHILQCILEWKNAQNASFLITFTNFSSDSHDLY